MVYAENYSNEFTGRRIPEDAKHSECLETIENWLKRCFEEHEGCARPEAAHLPTRVIDVGPPNGSQPPKLLHAQGMQGQWVSLSHRWGKDKFLTTTTGNLKNHLQSIPWHKLPRRFQDAIVLTRKLGFRYLWIDSLCIVQDSKEDWIAESSKMGIVYKHSTLNLAAGHPLTSELGIMADRVPDTAYGTSFPSLDDIRFTYPSTSTGFVQRVGVQKFPKYAAFSANDNDMNSLVSRGWVLQEAVLSPRTITWTAEQMTWQCRTCVSAEYQRREHMFEHVQEHAYGENHNLKNVFRTLSTNEDSKNASYDAWYRILAVYGESNLTNPGDVLHAISGVAQEIQEGTGDTYCAGIWLNDLRRSLLWHIDDRVGRETGDEVHPLSSYAPSWSWASRKGAKSMRLWDFGKHEFTDDILHVINIDYPSRVAGIAEGSSPVSITVKALIRDSPVGYGDASMWKGRIDYRISRWLVFGGKPRVELVYELDSIDCAQPSDGSYYPEFLEQVWCLAVGTVFQYGSQRRCGLLLQESNKKQGTYQRIGQFDMDIEWECSFGEWVQREVTIL